jgi:hypothetical protein
VAVTKIPPLRTKRAKGGAPGNTILRSKAIYLESFSKELEKNVTDQPGDCGDHKIRRREDICHRPSQPLLLTQSRALKFSHEKIGIKKEDDEADLDHRSPNVLFHGDRDFWLSLPKITKAKGTRQKDN